MALPFDIDIYGYLLNILGVTPTGDPVADAVYLVLLPMIVLYMYINKVVGGSRFTEHYLGSKKIETIIMFIIGFFIVREGYYPLFASFSMPLLIIIMLWHTLAFVFGKRNKGSPGSSGSVHTKQQIGSGGGDRNSIELIRDIVELPEKTQRQLKNAATSLGPKRYEKAMTRLEDLEEEYTESQNAIKESRDDRGGHAGDLIDTLRKDQKEIVDEAKSIRLDHEVTDDDMKTKAPKISRVLRI